MILEKVHAAIIAAAVFLENGSNKIDFGLIDISFNFSIYYISIF